MKKRLRPSLSFLTRLPTLKVKESYWHGCTWWKVEPQEEVVIIDPDDNRYQYPLDYFWVLVISSAETGKPLIGITFYKNFDSFVIKPREEKYYLKNEWWKKYTPEMF
jgi:hypothetical protein